MNSKLKLLVLCSLLTGLSHSINAQGTTFTYQGRLTENGTLANGANDFTFTLYNAASSGATVGVVNLVNDLTVSNGLFTATLDFGAAFDGNARWLEIAVRPGASSGAYTNLAPRQPITAAPYAMRSLNAGTAALATSVAAGTVNNSGLAGDAVDGAKILNGSITSADLNASLLNSTFWKLGGNAGTTPGAHFIGTSDNQALQLKVNNSVALQISPGVTVPNVVGGLAGFIPTAIGSGVSGAVVAGGNAPAAGVTGFGGGDFHAVYDSDGTIGGGFGNKVGTDNANANDAPFATVAGGVFNSAFNYAATVAGGDGNIASGTQSTVGGGASNQATNQQATVAGGLSNQATGSRSTVGGGQSNFATNTHSSVAGGGWNTASGVSSFIGGGGGDTFGGPWPNTASGNWSAILGGWNNKASGYSSVVGGGGNNTAAGQYAVVPGGSGNTASNTFCFAAGGNARAIHDYSFVWSDGTAFSSTKQSQFAVMASGGARFATPLTPNYDALNQFIIGPATNSGLQMGYHTYNGIWDGAVIQAITGGSASVLELNPLGGVCMVGGALQALANVSGQSLDVSTVARINGNNNWNVTGGEGDFRVGNASYRFKIGVATGGGGAGDIWMRAHGGIERINIKAPGGTRILSNEAETAGVSLGSGGTSWAVISDRNVKKDFSAVDSKAILEKLASMPITQWHYNWESPDTTPHIGPMAQDFKAAFYPGTDDKSITTQEADGVTFAAIQGLNQKLEEARAENAELKARLEKLEQIMHLQHGGLK